MAQSHPVDNVQPRITLKPISSTVSRQAIRPPVGSTMPSPAEDDDEIVELSQNEMGEEYSIPPPQRAPSNRLTKTGKPDRRFKGQRDLPDEEVSNPYYRKASVGGEIGGVHVTQNLAPDRRFKENRGKSEEEVLAEWAEKVYQQFHSKNEQH